jgi:hypothetical protein
MEEIGSQKNFNKITVSGRISNSALSKFNVSEGGSPFLFKLFIEGYRKNLSSYSIEIGKLIHAYFEDESIVEKFDLNKPSDSIVSWVESFYSVYKDNPTIDRDDLIISSKESAEVFSNMKKRETIINKFNDLGQNYLDYLIKMESSNEEKIIVSTKEYNDLIKAIEGVKANEEAYSLLREGNKEFKVLHNDRLTGLKMKSIIDNLIIDDSEKKIYITDLKTTSCGHYDLINYFKERNYDRQLAIYRDAVVSLIDSNELPDYKIECYIVNVSISFGKSVVYKISEKTLCEGENKYRKLLSEIKKHKDLDYWDSTLEEKEEGYYEL